MKAFATWRSPQHWPFRLHHASTLRKPLALASAYLALNMPDLEPFIKYTTVAAVGAGLHLLYTSRRERALAPKPLVAAAAHKYSEGELSTVPCSVSGTMLLCCQNLAVSGANQGKKIILAREITATTKRSPFAAVCAHASLSC